MARTRCLSDDSTSFDIIDSNLAEAQMLIRSTEPTMADAMYLDSEPTSKARLARSLAHMYEERGAAPLPNFDEFLFVLACPRWKWTPQASTLFRRIRRIIHDSRRSSPVQETQREREASEATVYVSTTEGSVRCSDEWSQVS